MPDADRHKGLRRPIATANLLTPLLAGPAYASLAWISAGPYTHPVSLSELLAGVFAGTIFGWPLSFVPVAIVGTTLASLARQRPALRSWALWAAVGALTGGPFAAWLLEAVLDWTVGESRELLACGAAGAGFALAYRRLVRSLWRRQPPPTPPA